MLKSDALSQLKQFKQELRIANNQHEGVVKGSPGRFGFLTMADGKEAFLSPDEMSRVFPGDKVLATVTEDDKGRLVAKIDECLHSELKYLVGRYLVKGQGHFVEPDLQGLNRWIFLPPKKRKQAKAGDFILCRVLQHPFKDGKPQAEIVRVIGHDFNAMLASDYSIAKYNLTSKNPGRVDAKQALATIERETGQRTDLRTVPFLTIDASTTQDMDDALYAEETTDGWKLQVAIADPTAFFEPGSDLDKHAKRLGSSWYFPDRVLSMLPAELANKFCSLVPGKDRLVLLCTLQISKEGEVRDYSMETATISSAAKLSYEEVATLLKDPDALQSHPQGPQLTTLQQVTEQLLQWRRNNALVTPDRPDYRIVLDDQGQVSDIKQREVTQAHSVIEEAMIAANLCATDFLQQGYEQALYTAHSGFRPERLEQIQKIAEEQVPGLDIAELAHWHGFMRLWKALEDAPDSDIPVAAIASRLLARGELSAKPAPHAGMGLPAYTTFTSPIRKYNDLLVHRLIKAKLEGRTIKAPGSVQLEKLQEQLRSGRRAVAECENWLKREFAKSLIGKPLSGTIQHTNGAGFQVRLDASGIEGNVNLGELEEKFRFDGIYFQHSSDERNFRLGQPVIVEITSVDTDKRTISMALAERSAETDEIAQAVEQ